MNFNVGVYDPENVDGPRRLACTSLICPSDPDGLLGIGAGGDPAAAAATPAMTSSYAGVHHDAEAPIDVTNNGVFFLNSAVRYEEIERRRVADDLRRRAPDPARRPRLGLGHQGHAPEHRATRSTRRRPPVLPLPALPARHAANVAVEDAARTTPAAAEREDEGGAGRGEGPRRSRPTPSAASARITRAGPTSRSATARSASSRSTCSTPDLPAAGQPERRRDDQPEKY